MRQSSYFKFAILMATLSCQLFLPPSLSRAAAQDSAPWRIDAIAADLDIIHPNGYNRARDLGEVMNALVDSSGDNSDGTYTLDGSERIIRALESSKNMGVLYDGPTMMLGLRQTPRYLNNGFDNAKLLVDATAKAALAAKPGTRGIYVCNFTENCKKVVVTQEEFGSLIDPRISISRNMAPNRAFKVTARTAAAMGYIAAMNNPQIVTGVDKTPAQYLSQKMAAAKGVDVVSSNRADMRGCISESEPTFDLASCVKIGAQAAVYNIAQTGKPFIERNPLLLIRLPDY